MSKGNTFENELLAHIFTNADIALIGDATGLRGSTTAGSLYLALHTADPGEAGSQNTSEHTYAGYVRLAVARSGGNWTLSGNEICNAIVLQWATGTSGTPTQDATHWSIGVSLSGAGKILYKGAFAVALYTGNTIAPQVAIGVIGVSGLRVQED